VLQWFRDHYFGFFKKVRVATSLHVWVCWLLVCEEESVSRTITATLLLALSLATFGPGSAAQQTSANDEIVRRAKSKVQPAYPELARKMSIAGTVKIEVTVATNGTVKEARIVGGHPVLANAALDAAKKWRFEPASAESTGVIDFKFEPR
jgi:TonB family protein